MAGDQIHHGIAQKFQALVVRQPLCLHFIDKGAVPKGFFKKRRIGKRITEFFFQF